MPNYSLIFEEKNLIDIPFEILITAHWRPQDAQLKKEFKRESQSIDQKEYQRLNEIWKTREVWINYCLELLYLSTPKNILSEIFNNLIGKDIFEPLSSYSLKKTESLKKWTGVPDFILRDKNNSAIFGEIKIAALKANHKYSFQQYQKYMLLTVLYLLTHNINNSQHIRHFVILPFESIADNINDYATWKPEVKSNVLVPFSKYSKNDKLKQQLLQRLNVFLTDKNISKENSIIFDNVKHRIENIEQRIITHVFTWSLFLETYKEVIKGKRDSRIVSFVDRLKELTNTNYVS